MREPSDDLKEAFVTALRSDPLSFVLDSVSVFGLASSPDAGVLLGGSPKGVNQTERLAMIESVRAGKQLELEVPAIVYRQKAGKPNRNGLRFSAKKLGRVAKSFATKPMLVDHRARMQSARIGTIVSSELADGADDETAAAGVAFRQVFRVVKPDAVISVLDGTIDRFSIGWAATGPVICSVHGTEVWSECSCWPLDTLTIDGETKIVEYEFTSAEGDETSSVNTPAVAGTKIEDVRSALTAEITPHLTRTKRTMALTRLAAVLGLAALTDTEEAAALTAVGSLTSRAITAENALAAATSRATTAETELAAANVELTTLRASAVAGQADAIIEGAYTSGRLAIQRDAAGKRTPNPAEVDLRKYGAALGVAALKTLVDGMPQTIPVAQRALSETVGEPADPVITTIPGSVLESVAAQLGLDPKAVAENAAMLQSTRRHLIPMPNTSEPPTRKGA